MTEEMMPWMNQRKPGISLPVLTANPSCLNLSDLKMSEIGGLKVIE